MVTNTKSMKSEVIYNDNNMNGIAVKCVQSRKWFNKDGTIIVEEIMTFETDTQKDQRVCHMSIEHDITPSPYAKTSGRFIDIMNKKCQVHPSLVVRSYQSQSWNVI